MTNEKALKKGKDLIEKSKAAYLTTLNSEGYPETRAMLNLRSPVYYPALKDFFMNKENMELFFTTNTSSAKVSQIRENPKVSVYFCDDGSFQGLMCRGKIEIITDRDTKHALWHDEWTMYYPEGKDSPDYTVLRLKPDFIKSYSNLSQVKIKL
jgi:general stress protein 26